MAGRIFRHSFSLLHVDHVYLDEKWNYHNIISPYYRLYYIDDGNGCIWNDRERLDLEAGYLYMVPCFTPCNLSCEGFLSQYFIQFLEDSADGISLFANNRSLFKTEASSKDIENFKRVLEINRNRGINGSDNPSVYEKSVYYKEYQELNNLQSLSTYLETQGIIFQLLSKFLSSRTFKNIRTAIPSKIVDAINFIQLNLKQNLSVQLLADRAGQHPDYFSRIFAQNTGERPISYIQGKRIERSQYLITTSNIAFEQIAQETGFESLPYFFRIFKKMTGMTPAQYRLQTRLDIESTGRT